MKLPTKLTCTKFVRMAGFNKGSLIIEAMVAVSVMTIFIVSALSLTWSARALRPILDSKSADILAIRDTIESWLTLPGVFTKWFDDSSVAVFPLGASSSISTVTHDEKLSFGSSTCLPTSEGTYFGMFRSNSFLNETSIGDDVFATDIIAKNDFVYLSTDSTTTPRNDFFIYDNRGFDSPKILSSIDTGPGISAITSAGQYIYAANTSTVQQLQVIDISNRSNPVVVSSLKLPLPASTTPPTIARSIAYFDKKIYLGTEKWNGPEFEIIDVSDPLNPRYLGGLEIGAVVKSILVRGDRAYIANAGQKELILADITNPSVPRVVSFVSPLGWQIEEGSKIIFHHDKLWYGRAGGGIGNSAYQELMLFHVATSSGDNSLTVASSTHIRGGVYGIAAIDPYIFVATGDQSIEVWNDTLTRRITITNAWGHPVAMSCDRNNFYMATSDSQGYAKVNLR